MKRSPEFSQTQAGQALLDTYQQDTLVVVNIGGEWKEAKVAEMPTFDKDNALQLKVDVVGGQREILVFEIGEEPEIIVGDELTQNGITDVNLGETFDVSNPFVSPDGHIEYTLTASDGKIYDNVAQELLLAWKKTLELEIKVAELEQEIDRVREDKKEGLQAARVKMQLDLLEVHKHLPPDVSDLQDADRAAVERIKKEVDKIHEEASKAIKEFEEKVVQFEKVATSGVQKTGDALIEDHATPFVDTKYLSYTQYAMDKESAADKERRLKQEKEEHEETKQFAQQLKKQILDEIEKILQEKTYKERQVPRGDAAARVIINTDAENKRKDLYGYIFGQLEAAPSGYQKKLWDFLQKTRIDLASHTMMGVIDIPGAPGIPAHKDFNNAGGRDSIMFGKNVELLKSVVEEQLKEYEPKDLSFDPKGKEIFDWEKEKEAVVKRMKFLKKKLEENNSEALQIPEKKQQYQTLIGLETNMSAHFQMLKDLDTIPDSELRPSNPGVADPKNIVGINNARYDYLNTYLSEIRNVEKALLAIDETSRKNAEEKQIEDKRKEIENDPEKKKFKGEGIDIPDYELREMLLQHLGGVHSAMELLMRGGVTQGKNGEIEVKPDLIVQMKGLFGDTPPKKSDGSSFDIAQLRKFGIKNWDKFKELWDTELAEKSIFILNDILTKTLERYIAENTSWWDKMKTHKGKIIGAATTNLVLLGGASFGISKLITEITNNELAQSVAVATVGGAGSGAAKYGLLKKIFGSQKAKEKAAKRDQELHDTKQKKIIENILSHIFDIDKQTGNVTGAKSGIDGFDSFTRILAHTIRETTVGSETFGEGEESITLTGDDLLIYRQKLNALAKKHPDEKMKLELARSIQESSINTQTFTYEGEQISLSGGQLLAYREYLREYVDSLKPEEKVDETVKAKLAWAIAKMKSSDITMVLDKKFVHNPNIVDTILSNISGKGTMKGSMITNVGLSSVMMLDPIARTLFGGFVMGKLGTEIGEQLYYKSERKGAEGRIEALMKSVAEKTEAYRVYKTSGTSIPFDNKNALTQDVLALKRLLYATAPPEDMAAIIYKVKQKGVHEKDAEDGSYKKGDPLPPEVRFDSWVYTEIQSLVYEAERENVFLDEEKNKATLETVLKAQQATTDAIAEKQLNKNKKWTKKLLYKGGGLLAGAVVGAAVSVVTGAIAKKLFEHDISAATKKELTALGVAASAKGQSLEEAAASHVQASTVEAPAGSGHTDIAPPPRDTPAPAPTPKHPEVAPVQVEKSPDIVEKSFGADDINKGEGPEFSMNRLLAKHDLGMNHEQLEAFKKVELGRMGINRTAHGDEWAIQVRLHHKGDIIEHPEVELYKGTDGQPHFRLIGEEGKTIFTHDNYRIPTHGGQEKASAGDVNAKPDSQTQLEKSSLKPGHTKTATADAKGSNTLDKQQELSKASGKPAGETPLEKQQARFDEALKTKGGVKEFQGGIRKDGNVMVEFQNGDKQLYPAEMLGLSAGENGTLILNVPVDVASAAHTGTASSGGVSSGGGGSSSSFSVGAKVPEGAKFFVTPDEAEKNTASHIVEQQARESGGGTDAERTTGAKNTALDTAKADTTEVPASAATKRESADLVPGAETIENRAAADTYDKSLQIVMKELDKDAARLNIVRTPLVSNILESVSNKFNGQFDFVNHGTVPAALDGQVGDPQAVKEYILEHLDPVEKLLYTHGADTASLEGATAVDMAKAPISEMIRLELPSSAQKYFLLPPDGFVFGKDTNGYLVLISDADHTVKIPEIVIDRSGMPSIQVRKST